MKGQKPIVATLLVGIAFSMASTIWTPARSTAAEDRGFSLQITPSPLVTTLKPGQTTDLELKIRNGGTTTENLKIEPRSFKIDAHNSSVELSDTPPTDVKNWISFGSPNFSVEAGQWYAQKIRFSLPKDTGFSYSFALVISRQKEQAATSGGRLIKGSVAVFTLINVDRPGATRKLQVTNFGSTKHIYEYLPTELSVQFKNTGNSIVQPYGNVFIQRDSNAKSALATLPVNEQQGYILPGVQRSLAMSWSDGFPHYKTTTESSGVTKRSLVWNWSDLSKLRVGRYTAKLVAVYNDGGRDVPVEGEVSFWVIPWKILLGTALFVILMLFGLWSLIRKIISIFRRVSKKSDSPKTEQ